MIKYLVLCSLFFTVIGNAQQSEFDTLLSLFDTTKKEIPTELAYLYFDFTPSEKAIALIADKVVVKTDSFITVSTYNQCDAETICKHSTITSFTLKGKKIGAITFERVVSDCSFDDARVVVFASDDVLVFKELRKKLDCLGNGGLISSREWLEFQPIDKDGTFLKSYVDKKAIEREHYIYSHKVFTKEELEKQTEGELSIIRNELFASHGYVFTSPEWQDYFESKPWYEGTSDDVTEKLSEIEKKNIALILSITQGEEETTD